MLQIFFGTPFRFLKFVTSIVNIRHELYQNLEPLRSLGKAPGTKNWRGVKVEIYFAVTNTEKRVRHLTLLYMGGGTLCPLPQILVPGAFQSDLRGSKFWYNSYLILTMDVTNFKGCPFLFSSDHMWKQFLQFLLNVEFDSHTIWFSREQKTLMYTHSVNGSLMLSFNVLTHIHS